MLLSFGVMMSCQVGGRWGSTTGVNNFVFAGFGIPFGLTFIVLSGAKIIVRGAYVDGVTVRFSDRVTLVAGTAASSPPRTDLARIARRTRRFAHTGALPGLRAHHGELHVLHLRLPRGGARGPRERDQGHGHQLVRLLVAQPRRRHPPLRHLRVADGPHQDRDHRQRHLLGPHGGASRRGRTTSRRRRQR